MQLVLIILNFVLVSPISSEFATHKFYVSTTEVKYKKESNTLQITSQFFIDDLEQFLQKSEGSLRLDPDSNIKLIDSLLERELKKSLKFSINNELKNYTYLGREYKNDILLCYLELQFQETPEILYVKNTFFFDIFDEQKNIIHFKSEKIRKSFLLHSEKNTATIKLNN